MRAGCGVRSAKRRRLLIRNQSVDRYARLLHVQRSGERLHTSLEPECTGAPVRGSRAARCASPGARGARAARDNRRALPSYSRASIAHDGAARRSMQEDGRADGRRH